MTSMGSVAGGGGGGGGWRKSITSGNKAPHAKRLPQPPLLRCRTLFFVVCGLQAVNKK